MTAVAPKTVIEAPAVKVRQLAELQERLRTARADSVRSRLDRYYPDPVGFARDCIAWPEGDSLTPYQAEILEAIPTRRRVAVRGPHGLGKTTTFALAVLWFALTRDAAKVDWKCVTTAGAWRQLEQYLWPEIHKWARRVRWDQLGRSPLRPGSELLTLNLRLRYGSAFAVASDQPALIEGAHADSVLYLFDESKAIPAGTFDAAEGAFSGAQPYGLPEAFGAAQSTPGAPSGRFYDIHARRPGFEDWWTRHVTADEAVDAGRISREWLEQRRRQWGADSALYANRALGQFHADDEDGVIPLAWLEAANERWTAWDRNSQPVPAGRRVLGVDVARGGGDLTAFAARQGNIILGLERHDRADTMVIAGMVAARLTPHPHSTAVVDSIGVGAGVLDRLREQGVGTLAFTASAGTARRDASGEFGYVNVRAEGWWNLREMLDPAYHPTLAIPPDDLLAGDLTSPRWRVMSGGRLQVEGKDDIRKRLGRSTDTGDAVVQACWASSAVGDGQDDTAVPYGVRPFEIGEAAVPYN